MKTTHQLAVLVAALASIAFADRAWSDTFGSGANTFNIEFVTIGNPGNAADTTGTPNPVGSVPYTYRIGKYAVSRDMIDKANAEGGLDISMHAMSFVTGGPRADMPATGITWADAARFVNWLNTSTGRPPAYKFALQPGDPGYLANAPIELWEHGEPGFNPNNRYRNSLAWYFLPSVDEWYKAAYYDPSANGGSGGYWNYPTGSDSLPTAVASGTAAGTAVYDQSMAAGPADITLAGGLSPYGTMGQSSNVSEWEETSWDLTNSSSASFRGIRTGNWYLHNGHLLPTARFFHSPYLQFAPDIGFRVASIPEPSSLLLVVMASLGWLLRRPYRK